MNQHTLNQERQIRGDTSWPADHGCDGRGVPGVVQGLGPGRVIRDCAQWLPCCARGGGERGLYFCTLGAGHTGPHMAQGRDDQVIAEWPNA